VAEIGVHRKQSSLWIWIAGLVLLVVLVWGMSRALHRSPAPIDTGTAEVDITAPPQPPVRLPVA
jgi:Na+-transporting methylmalonyl-CoA/oxaloacetate decarboxylase gamma subunit